MTSKSPLSVHRNRRSRPGGNASAIEIVTSGKSSAERAAIAVAREAGIPCVVIKPRRRGPDRRGHRKCLQHCSAAADGSLVLGDKLTPSCCSADVEAVLQANKPTSCVSTRVALMFRSSAANTQKWIRKHQIKKLHVAGRAPKAMAAKFLRAVLANHD